MGIIPERKTVDTVPPFEELSILIFGIQGSGKTTFCNGDLNSITVAAEPGAEFVQTRAVPVHKWDTFIDVLVDAQKHLKEDPEFCSAIIIDIVDNLYDFCLDHVCAQRGIAHPNQKKDYGETWREVTKEWIGWLRHAMRFINLRFITHRKEVANEIINSQGLIEEITQVKPRYSSGGGAVFLDGVCQMVGHMYVNKKGQHCITFRTSAYVAAKDRTGILKELEEIVLPENPQEGFKFVADLYRKRAKEQGFIVQSRRINDDRRDNGTTGTTATTGRDESERKSE